MMLRNLTTFALALASLAALAFGLGVPIAAQTRAMVAQGDLLYWEITAPDAPTAAGYTVHLLDAGVQVVPSWPVVGCSSSGAAGIFTCRATVPLTLAPGDHTLTVTAITPMAAESSPSNPLLVTVTLPRSAQPHNLRSTPQ